jgi:hypothetical protein
MAKILIGGKSFEIADDKLKEAIEKQTEIAVDDKVVIRTEDEDTAFQNNLKTAERTAALEIAVKKTRETLGLNFEGKTIEKLVDAVKAKTLEEANIEPNEKLKTLQNDIQTLKGTIQTLSTEKENAFSQLKQFKTETIVSNTLSSLIPKNVILPKSDMEIIIKNKFGFDVDESGNIVVKQGNDILKNPTTLDPLAPKDVISKFFEENPTYLKGAGGGSGDGDSGNSGGVMTLEKYVENAQKEGKQINSVEFSREVEQAMKDGKIK